MNLKMLYKRGSIRALLMSVSLLALIFILPAKAKAAPKEETVEEVVEEMEPEVIKPTLNAAVSDKCLTVNAESEVGIKAIYVNGYQFLNSGNGNLKIMLTQFDAGYNKFYIYAEDINGVTSELYELDNPYYDNNPDDEENPAGELPVDVSPTEPSEATGVVTEHFLSQGREFYTIETINGKVFYLIVDMTTEEEKVYFLTEINENDLLNTTTNNSDKLPRNSAVAEGAIPDDGKVIVNNNASESTITAIFGDKKETNVEMPIESGKKNSVVDNTTSASEEQSTGISKTTFIYAGMGVLCVGVIVIVTLSKRKKKKKKDSLAEDTETDDEEE